MDLDSISFQDSLRKWQSEICWVMMANQGHQFTNWPKTNFQSSTHYICICLENIWNVQGRDIILHTSGKMDNNK